MVIGFFMPLPLAMMIPFMGIQSAVMAKQFGENFQYGKRRISAMDNDEFNKLTPAKLMSNANRELAEMIPAMKDSIIGMHDFQEFLVREFLIMIDNVIKAGLGELLGLSEESLTKFEQNVEHFLHGHFHFQTGGGGTGGGTSTPPPEGVKEPPNLLSLTLSQISAANDSVLLSWIQNISDYTAQTQQWLINERQRRKDESTTTPPSGTEFSPLQIEFLESLKKSDFSIGGQRTRNFKGTIMEWNTPAFSEFTNARSFITHEWKSNTWIQVSAKHNAAQSSINTRVNDKKSKYNANFVMQFNDFYYYIKMPFLLVL